MLRFRWATAVAGCGFVGAGLGCVLLFLSTVAAQEPAKRKPAAVKLAATADDGAAELAAIRQSSRQFVEAFNQADARRVAALWTLTGEYVNDSGRVFSGREEIEREYARFFKAHPGHKMHLAIDSLKLLSDSAAMEDGRAMLDPEPAGAPAISKYTVVHVKVDGKWLMSSVRDTHVPTASAYRHLEDLEWLVGSWSAEEHGAKTEMTCRWIANKSFLERAYRVTKGSQVIAGGVQIVGWNAQLGRPQSWLFAADGGHVVGQWTPKENGWRIDSQGMLADGTPTSAVTTFTKLDDNAFAWQSLARTAAGMALPDTDELVLKRVQK